MTGHPPPVPVTFWFFDTVSLLTMTLDSGFTDVVDREVARTNGQRFLPDVVTRELEIRSGEPDTKDMAIAALTATNTPEWKSMRTTSVDPDRIADVQLEVADGRYLPPGSMKHWAESVMITMFRGLSARHPQLPVVLLSDDYDARRVANLGANVRPCHLAALTYSQFLRGEVPQEELLRLTAVAHDADRGPELLAGDLPRGWRGLGRAGEPPFV